MLWRGKVSVIHLHISFQLSILPQHYFSSVPNVQYINMEGNNFKVIENLTFHKLANLEDLNMERNAIAIVDAQALVGLIALKWLKLAYNDIKQIELRYVPVGCKIDLRRNKIQSIQDLNGLDVGPLHIYKYSLVTRGNPSHDPYHVIMIHQM